jgi:hypothetical protein
MSKEVVWKVTIKRGDEYITNYVKAEDVKEAIIRGHGVANVLFESRLDRASALPALCENYGECFNFSLHLVDGVPLCDVCYKSLAYIRPFKKLIKKVEDLKKTCEEDLKKTCESELTSYNKGYLLAIEDIQEYLKESIELLKAVVRKNYV